MPHRGEELHIMEIDMELYYFIRKLPRGDFALMAYVVFGKQLTDFEKDFETVEEIVIYMLEYQRRHGNQDIYNYVNEKYNYSQR
ncbi:hypothetical protein KC909_02785 [Candidatus Dojkabacteria bacterium]|uniref:Uncharacterized protein n=1 Tax=Candidatus Dojkabacteria bacterium TaxID=2099670 RepID=A0A955L5K2_9BACT|nr:hypothetical protein [Candidatus Dojkabacteria bacterium]